jgi:hypothetical protein
MRMCWACTTVALVACGCRPCATKGPGREGTGQATAERLDAGFAWVFPSTASPFVSTGPVTFGPGFARRVYGSQRKRVEVTVARLGNEPDAYERWVENSADYPQAPLPPSESNGFFSCAAGDSRIAGCDLHIQTRSGFHVEIMGDGHVSRRELIALLSHLRLTDLSDSFPPL